MKTLEEQMLDDILEIQADYGETITHKGAAVPAIVSPVRLSQNTELDGILDQDGLTLTAAKEDFETQPAIGHTFIYEGATYRIVSQTKDRVSYNIQAIHANKGA